MPRLVLWLWLGLMSCGGTVGPQPNVTDGTAWDHPGWACLRRTTPSLQLRYPEDAEEHFQAIHQAMHPWTQPPGHRPHSAANFQGPWVENLWIDQARRLNESRFRRPRFGRWTPQPLSAVFGPFIPLLFTWVDTWVDNAWHYPPNFLTTLQSVLRRDVPYVTVSQNDEGITGKCELKMKEYPNILVFSSGGYGHIPIPLFMRDQPLRNGKPMEQRQYLVSYVGGLDHSPQNLRGQMKAIVERLSVTLNFSSTIYRGPAWFNVMADSCTSLVPRGWGRTAYHLAEVIQMGLLPIYIYSDVPWVPYRKLFRKFGFATNISGLPSMLQYITTLKRGALAQREKMVVSLRHYFMPKMVLRQIFAYIAEQPSDLRCVVLPKTPKGKPCL